MTCLPKTKLKPFQSLKTPMRPSPVGRIGPGGLPSTQTPPLMMPWVQPCEVLLSPFSDGQTESQPTWQLSNSHKAGRRQSQNRPD